MPKLSLGSWAFSFGPFADNPWPFENVLEYAAKAGYEGIEINGFRPHPHPEVYNTALKCRELRKEIESYGLGISGYAPDFSSVPPAEADEERYLSVFQKSLEFCVNCGITTLRVDTVTPPVSFSPELYEKNFSRLARTWRAASQLAKERGILLVWEFEPGFWLNKPGEVKKLVEGVGHDNFKLLFDTSHAYMGVVVGARHTGNKELLAGGVIEYAALVAEHIGHFHLIDSDGTLHDNETSTHTPFGEGRIDFKQVLAAMRPVTEKLEWWCVDFCFCAEAEEAGIKAVSYLKQTIAEVYRHE